MSAESAIARAAAFVADHGDALARARAAAVAGQAGPAAVESMLAARELDREGSEAVLDDLRICADARLLGGASARACCARALALQAGDGAWRPDGCDDERALALTGRMLGHLARTRFVRPETLDAAARFMAAHWSPDRVGGGNWDLLDGYAMAFANLDHELSDALLQWCGRELEKGYRARLFDVVATMRVLVDCDAHSLPGATFEPGELLVSLVTEQASDGSFGTAAEAPARVPATLDALAALRHFSR